MTLRPFSRGTATPPSPLDARTCYPCPPMPSQAGDVAWPAQHWPPSQGGCMIVGRLPATSTASTIKGAVESRSWELRTLWPGWRRRGGSEVRSQVCSAQAGGQPVEWLDRAAADAYLEVEVVAGRRAGGADAADHAAAADPLAVRDEDARLVGIAGGQA